MLFRSVLAPFAALLLLLTPATAAELRQAPKAVLELFTSQGCSSCPAADALLTELGKRQDVVALAYHVDYWDYIGWPDSFGSRANSDRQRDYAESLGSSRIFTPQLVVNGRQGVVGSRADEVNTSLEQAGLQLPVTLATSEGMLEVAIPGQSGLSEAVVWLVTFIDSSNVEIELGENRGKTLTYTHIVTGRQALGMWEPVAGAHLRLPLAEVLREPSTGAVIMVQEEHGDLPGPILGAASISL